MQAMLKLPAPVNTVQSLRQFHDKMESYIRSLEAMGQTEETYGNLMVPVVLDKLPREVRRQRNWKLVELRYALKKEIRIMEADTSDVLPEVDTYNATASFYTSAKPTKKQRQLKSNRSFPLKCAFCQEDHAAFECQKFADANARVEVIKRQRLCFNCLGKHQVADCKSRNRCRKCRRKHHSAICKTNDDQGSAFSLRNQQTDSNLNPQAAVFHSTSTKNTTSTVLLKTAIATVSSDDTYTTAAVLFDEGAQRSFITRKLADDLCLKTERTETLNMSSFGSESNKVHHLELTTVHILTQSNEKLQIKVLIVPNIATPMSSHVTAAIAKYPYLQKLKLAHPASVDYQFNISILIGADYYWDIVEDKVVRGEGPTAVSSKVGYLLSGPLHKGTHADSTGHILNVLMSPTSIEESLEKYWKIENEDIMSGIDVSEENEMEYLREYQRTSIEFINGKYVAKLPWKRDHPELPSNYELAKKRTEATIRRLRKDHNILHSYGRIIYEQEQRGFIERVLEEDIHKDVNVHYIPHHSVMKDSSTTPVRISIGTTNQQQALIKRSKQLRHLINQFWTRWRREYLTALRERHQKSGAKSDSIHMGDVVQVHDDGPRLQWRLAVVDEFLTGNDGVSRAAKIRTCRGYTTRPIVKFYPLEIRRDNDFNNCADS